MKTNAVRLVEASGVEHELHTYSDTDGQIDAVSVAAKLGLSPERLFKTLVTRAHSREVSVFCIPGTTELDLKKAAAATGAKSIELVRVSELEELTGYVRGGCSPIGMKRRYPVWIEESATAFDRILVSGGAIGIQIEIAPTDLQLLVGAEVADLV